MDETTANGITANGVTLTRDEAEIAQAALWEVEWKNRRLEPNERALLTKLNTSLESR